MKPELNFLIVEDDAVDAASVRRILSHTGLAQHVQSVASLEQAKLKILDRHFDAVLLDLGLPDSQGIDSIIDFQASAPELPIIVLTGCQDEKTALRSVGIGAEDFINKNSITEESLSRSIRYAIERHHHKQQVFGDIDALRLSRDDAIQKATTDPLSAIPNRRGLQLHLEQLRENHPGKSLLVAVADLDHFKNINDTLGHGVGDRVIKEFAARLQDCLQGKGFVARIGGDEFVIVFASQQRPEAAALAERIISHTASSPARDGGFLIPFSATLAVTEIRAPFTDLERILAQADVLLAQGKSRGGNLVEYEWSTSENTPVAMLPPEIETPFSEEPSIREVRQIQPFSFGKISGNHLAFSHDSRSSPPFTSTIDRARIADRLSDMTLKSMQLGFEWRLREAPESQLHLDVETDAIEPWFCSELNRIFRREEDRANCILFFRAGFSGQSRAASLADLRPLRQSGFQIGARNVGDGATSMEQLLLLSPQWIRFDPAMTTNVSRYKKKADDLSQMIAMLRPLNAKFIADKTETDDDLGHLLEFGFVAYYSNANTDQVPLGQTTEKMLPSPVVD